MAFTVADYVIQRLGEQHVDTLFGVPAAYCAPIFDAALAKGMAAVINASDLEACYAADGYARTKGLGAVSVAYGVGTLSMLNAIAGAYVERSPIVVINGGPTPANRTNLRKYDVVFSHSVGQDTTDLTVYKQVTAKAGRAATVAEVPPLVDGAISAALKTKRPVYIEINMGLWHAACPKPTGSIADINRPAGTEKQLAATIVRLIRAARSPVVLVGTEVQRYGLADRVAELIAKLGVRWATALLAKSVLPEKGPGWLGVYDPPYSRRAVKNAVENADLLVTLGCVFPNGYARLVQRAYSSMVDDNKVRIKTATKQRADIGALVSELVKEATKAPPRPVRSRSSPLSSRSATGALTYQAVFERIGAALDPSWLAIPDTFLGIHAAANLPIVGRDAFLCSGVWSSIGHSAAAAVGASFGSNRRPLVICGDGGFHMTAQALSTMVHYGRNPVIVLIANGIYGYEQYLVDSSYFDDSTKAPRPYVALNQWDFISFGNGVGLKFARTVSTVASFDAALVDAKGFNGPALIVAQIDSHGLPSELS